MPDEVARFPGRAPIDAYGNGGFRFAGMSHRGSLLLLPSGIYAWEADAAEGLTGSDLGRLFAETERPQFVLLGTGEQQVFPGALLRQAFAEAGIGLEPMSTGAACRTYNILLAEKRAVSAALIAVP